MSEHVLISCNQCQRGLRVRVNYLGQSVGCNHCGHLFVAEVREDGKSAAFGMPSTSVRFVRSDPAEPPKTSKVHDQGLQQLKKDQLRLKSENDRLASRLAAANSQRLSLQLRVEDLESQLRQAHEHVQLIQDELAACEVGRSELNRLRIESFALREKAVHALRLEDELQSLQQFVEERRAESEEKLARATRERDQAVSELAKVKQGRDRALNEHDRVTPCEQV
ncbi:hypothetical protein Sinac_2372 [Singulisphaera acidiphila DSM 18658]|uniref:Uncharacterized protein n=1 Tax=Singulisphaera acidiphila (strain ATCC BAA-1392 / DSM 18658 / VKM B-2454 / MOB10) TaxID=886293 RepID=L0DBC6_SINAD|nr:hypothetical protein Sinac_2372 [Singulisphaera acidiphila DSM 18658]